MENPLDLIVSNQGAIAATNRLAELQHVLVEIDNEEKLALDKKADAIRQLAHVTRIRQAISNHQKNRDHFLDELQKLLISVDTDLKPQNIISLITDDSEIEKLASILQTAIESQATLLTSIGEGSLSNKRESAEAEIKIIRSQLDEKQRLFLVYKDQLAQWEQVRDALLGSKEKGMGIAWLKIEIEELDLLPAKLDELKKERFVVVRQLHKLIGKVVAEYRTLYHPVQSFVHSISQMNMPFPLDFDVRVAEEGFLDRFFEQINRQARGSFAGIDESNTLIRSILKETNFTDCDSLVRFVELIDDMLHFDRRENGSKDPVLIADQLRKNHHSEELYDFLFGLQYLKPQYSLTYDGQEISQLSPGEHGLLLLVFYLLVDKDDIPLVIDQPEENLDNQTIFRVLVRCIKIAKQRRQVIMVTHNPNLAVVCDAEQIIYAECDKATKEFMYTSGPSEDPDIRSLVITILEGTRPAFLNRQKKYDL